MSTKHKFKEGDPIFYCQALALIVKLPPPTNTTPYNIALYITKYNASAPQTKHLKNTHMYEGPRGYVIGFSRSQLQKYATPLTNNENTK